MPAARTLGRCESIATTQCAVFEIVVAGDMITTTVNAQFIQRMTGVLPSGGAIGFQSEGTPVDFRRIVLTPLPATKNLHAPMPAR
ncbi:MAG: hypothetical protein ABIR80_05605 [Opitutaceae bacterium]